MTVVLLGVTGHGNAAIQSGTVQPKNAFAEQMRGTTMRRRLSKSTCFTRRRLAIETLESKRLLHAEGALSGFDYIDADGDGMHGAAELGVPGVVISLSGSDSSGASVDRSALTDEDGAYSFDDLEPGTYQLTKRQPAALVDSLASTNVAGAVTSNNQISNVVLADDDKFADNNFGERVLRPEFISLNWFFASTPSAEQMLRETIALGEELAGNLALAESIRSGGSNVPDEDPDTDPDDNVDPLFGPVTTGPFDDPALLGTRTDLVNGAPPISAEHVSTSVNYDDYSNPPTYGPHHGPVDDAQGNAITPRATGIYTTEQPDEDLVHNLEHGHVWISYNPSLIDGTDLSLLQQLVTDGGTDTGVILTPRSLNTSAITLASWAHLLTLDEFDGEQIRNFIETNRGHAPEGFIPSGQKASSSDSESVDDGFLHTLVPNQPFGPVTGGSVDDPNLRGTRMDTEPGAPPFSDAHITEAGDYTAFINAPSYGSHHGVRFDAQNNSITPRPTGVYVTEQPDEDLIHNLEHGHVWISYNPSLASASDVSALATLVEDGGTDTGVILTPRSKNTSPIVLTSWTRQLTLDSFDAATVRDFVITNRGHTPEGFIPSGQKTGNDETLDDGLPHAA
jgi:hypothetical protein